MAFSFTKTATAARQAMREFIHGSEPTYPDTWIYGSAEEQAQHQLELDELHRQAKTDVHTAFQEAASPVSSVTGKPLGDWLKPSGAGTPWINGPQQNPWGNGPRKNPW